MLQCKLQERDYSYDSNVVPKRPKCYVYDSLVDVYNMDETFVVTIHDTLYS